MRLSIFAALVAFPAHADSVAVWGYGPWSTAKAVLVEGQPHFAEITLENRLTRGPSDQTFTLTIGGIEMKLVVMQEQGDQPDTYIIWPPEGYIAAPPSLVVQEGDTGVIRIFRIEGAALG